MNFVDILHKLNVPSHNIVVYFHISINKMRTVINVGNLLGDVINYFDGKSTICMPSFPFYGNEYPVYIKSKPVFDVRNTPCRSGLIYELFRRYPNVIRSLHPWCPVACYGKLATDLISQHHLDIEPFGAKSPFNKILENNGIVIGLGVDCNTNSFAHFPDSMMQKNYCFDVFNHRTVLFDCLDYHGKSKKIATKILSLWLPKAIKPFAMRNYMLKEDFYNEFEHNKVPFYSLKIKEYIEAMYRINSPQVKRTGIPFYYNPERIVPRSLIRGSNHEE